MARQRAYLLITVFALLLVLFPFLFWYGTWFGRKLTDSQISEYLADRAKPRHAQHALVQVGERMARRDPTAARWYPQVVQLAASPLIELRQTAAWIMGQDHTYAPFHEALVKLTTDPQPMVRRNAALALSNFGDPAARPELMAMLRPYTIVSPAPRPPARQPMVRRNAALALSNFGDPAARPELMAMLRPYTIVSPAAGVVRYRLK